MVNDLESKILQIIDESPSKVDFNLLKRKLRRSNTTDLNSIKKAILNLISYGTLFYTLQYGQSYIERSLEQPIHVSPHIVIKPERCTVTDPGNCIVISIEKGASFGCGDHPTTRMAIQLMDNYMYRKCGKIASEKTKALDIGTGSGILAIAAAMLGINSVIAVDTDPCSIFEASRNVKINKLDDRVKLSGNRPKPIEREYDLIVANLRTPTLISLCGEIDKIAKRQCLLVFSGMKIEESGSVCESYEKMEFSLVEKRVEKGWSAICLRRG